MPSVVFEVNTSRNQSWKYQVSPGAQVTPSGSRLKSSVRLIVPVAPESRTWPPSLGLLMLPLGGGVSR